MRSKSRCLTHLAKRNGFVDKLVRVAKTPGSLAKFRIRSRLHSLMSKWVNFKLPTKIKESTRKLRTQVKPMRRIRYPQNEIFMYATYLFYWPLVCSIVCSLAFWVLSDPELAARSAQRARLTFDCNMIHLYNINIVSIATPSVNLKAVTFGKPRSWTKSNNSNFVYLIPRWISIARLGK